MNQAEMESLQLETELSYMLKYLLDENDIINILHIIYLLDEKERYSFYREIILSVKYYIEYIGELNDLTNNALSNFKKIMVSNPKLWCDRNNEKIEMLGDLTKMQKRTNMSLCLIKANL